MTPPSARVVTPLGPLPSVSRADLAAQQAFRRLASDLPARLAEALGELVGEPVSFTAFRARAFDAARIPGDALAVAVTPSEELGLGRAALVEVEPSLAAALVAKALRQRAPRIVDTSRGVAPSVAGALAAVLHAVLRRAHDGAALRIAAAGPAPVLGRELAAEQPLATAWFTVRVGPDTFDARVSLPLDGGAFASARTAGKGLAALGDLPLALPLVAATCTASRRDLQALVEGDAFVVPSFGLRAADDRLVGEVALVAPNGELGLAGDLAADGRLVIRTERATQHPWDRARWTNEEPAMPAETNATLEVLEDAPVVVRVELGTVEMTAREWASLAPGDVVTLGRKLGDPAILRVAGVAVAHGELVQVDGEYGVRIVGRGER